MLFDSYFYIGDRHDKREIVPVTNRNALPVERHMEMLNLNDEEHIYLACKEDSLENI